MQRTARQATVADPPAPRFELDRIDVDADTVRVVGWWYGVRGRRFIRPSLTAIGGGARARALAELEHKPWSAEGGQQWRAEFVWEHPLHDVEAFELAVAPDLAVRIPLPAAPQQASSEAATPGRAPDEVAKPRQTRAAARSNNRRGRVAKRHRSAPDADASLRLRLARAEQHLARVLSERDAAVTERDRLLEERGLAAAERDAAVNERDRLLEERGLAVAERDRLLEAHGLAAAERERLRDERGEALGRAATAATERARAVAEARRVVEERDWALQERDEALLVRAGAEHTRDALAEQHRVAMAERDRLSQALKQAQAEQTALRARNAQDRPARERLTRERDEALAHRDQIAAERDRHLRQRDEAAGERDRTLHELERVRRERDTALAHAERERAQARDLRGTLTELRARPGSGPLSAHQPTEPHVGAVGREAVRHEVPHPHGSAGQLRPRRAAESPRATPQLRPYRRMLARAIAVIAVLAVVLIVIAIVLSR